jgi:hypothetical protein
VSKYIIAMLCFILTACSSMPVRTFGELNDDAGDAMQISADTAPAAEIGADSAIVESGLPETGAVEQLSLSSDMRTWATVPLTTPLITGYCAMGTCVSVQSDYGYMTVSPAELVLLADSDYVVTFTLKNQTTTCTISANVGSIVVGAPQLYEMGDYHETSLKISTKAAVSGKLKLSIVFTDAGHVNPVDIGGFRIVKL